MAQPVFTNNARTTLSAGINNSVTSIAVVDGSVLPSPTGGNYAYVTIEEGALIEVVKMTARSTNTLTVTRAQDGTAAQTFTSAATVSVRVVKGVFDDIFTAVDTKLAASAVSTFGGTLIDDADASAARSTLELGTAAVINTGTSGGTLGLLNTNNTYSGTNIYSGTNTFNGALVSSSDSGTPSGKVQFGRSTAQYIDFHGSASGNFITTVSPGSNPKTRLYLGVSTDAGATHAATWVFDSADSSLKSGANTFWHSGTFDPTDYAALSGAAFTGACTITATTSLPMNFTRTGSSGGLGHRYTNTAGYLDWFAVPTGTDTGSMWSANALMQIGAGTAAAPTYAFSSDGDTGIFSGGTNILRFATGGTGRWQITAAGALQAVADYPILTGDGAGAAPSFAFADDPDTGLYSSGANTIGFSAGGTGRFILNTSHFYSPAATGAPALTNLAGTVSAPAFSFLSDLNTGMYRYTTDTVGIAAGGSVSATFSNTSIGFPAATTESRNLEIGTGRSGNGYAYIDFIGDATYTDYGLRLIRQNTGPNTTSSLEHRGTGPLILNVQDAGTIRASVAGTERVRINGATTQTLEVQGQINLTTSIGTLRSKIDWGITQTGLTISNEDNTPIYFRTTAVNRMSISDIGQVNIGTTTAHSDALLRVRRSGDGIEWGHATAAYHNTLGAEAGSGTGTLIFQGMTGATSNTYKTTGVQASIMKGNNAGGFLWGTVGSTNADNQAFSQTMSLNSLGHITATRIQLGYAPGTDNSIGCSNWFRSSGNSGWFSGTHGGGIYMIDTTWVRTYGSKSFYVANQIAATGEITAYYSDERLKTRVGSIEGALDKVCSLTGFLYKENELARSLGYNSDKVQVGLSAQAVQRAMPEVVSLAPVDMETHETTGEITSKSGENYLTVDYARIVPLLVEAIKELRGEVARLKGDAP